MNTNAWIEELKVAPRKKAMPVLSFPSVSLMGITVRELISDSALQARGMKLIADRTDAAAAVSMMDLSVEAEAFGAEVAISDDEVPTVTGSLVKTAEDAAALRVPGVGQGRTGLYLEAMEQVSRLITDRPVFAGAIGPFSLAGRLLGVGKTMVHCYKRPELVRTVLAKATEFLTAYILAYKERTGAAGVVMAEPLTGMLSPEFARQFSEPWCRQIVDAVQSDTFAVIYHNCGDNTPLMIDSILRTGSAAYHFGNSVSMKHILELVPPDTLVMGNVDPASQFRTGTPASIRAETLRILGECAGHPNFVISSGCDIPPVSPWENIDAFFAAVAEFYRQP